MIYNVIGPPGSGKTTFIRARFDFTPPMQTINATVFQSFIQRKVFEHTGLNPDINRYLATATEPIITVWFRTGPFRCIRRILKDGFTGKATLKQTANRLNILVYYHAHRRAIYLPAGTVHVVTHDNAPLP